MQLQLEAPDSRHPLKPSPRIFTQFRLHIECQAGQIVDKISKGGRSKNPVSLRYQHA
jgi:hypothetical protein